MHHTQLEVWGTARREAARRMILPPTPFFFGGEGAPKFLEHYKAHPDSHHVAKFHGDRQRELRKISKCLWRKKYKKNITGENISPSGTDVPGGLMIDLHTTKTTYCGPVRPDIDALV